MGSKTSVEVGPPEGPIVDVMRKKCGETSLQYLNTWTTEFGFPLGGSLSLMKLLALEEKLIKKEHVMRTKKKIHVKKLENVENLKKCLQMWKMVAETSNRKTMQKQLPFSHEKSLEKNEVQDCNTQRTSDSHRFPLSPQLAALTLDPDLDNNQSFHPSPPPPYNPTTPGKTTNTPAMPHQNVTLETARLQPATSEP